MASLLDATIIVLSIVTLALIIRNMIVYDSSSLTRLWNTASFRKFRDGKDGSETGSGCNECPSGYVAIYKSKGFPANADASRIKAIIKSSRLSVSLVNNLKYVSKSKLIRYLEREIDRVELAYSTTGHVKYSERLNFLRELYRLVNSMSVSYAGGVSLIVWGNDSKHEEIVSEVESLVKLIEAETGLTFRKVESLKDAFSVEPYPENLDTRGDLLLVSSGRFDKPGIIVGFLDDDYIEPVTLGWPHDFEAHIGVFGPTGRGKTVLLAGIAAQLGIMSESKGSPYMVLVIDPKGDLTNILSTIGPSVIDVGDCIMLPSTRGEASILIESSISASPESTISICEGSLVKRGFWILDLSHLKPEDRSVAASLALSSILVEALERGLPGRIAVIIDEAWRLARGRSTHLEMALREGRSRGVHIVYATQSPSDMPHGVINNTRVVFAFSGYSSSYSKEVSSLGFSPDLLSSMPVGTALLRIDSLGVYKIRIPDFRKLLKTPYYS